MLPTMIAFGVPYRFVGNGWDPTPLVFGITLILLARVSGFPLKTPVVVAALVGGLLLDLLADVVGVSMATALALVILPFAIVSLLRIPGR